MRPEGWKIIYCKYEGMQKKAIDLLSKEAGKYLIRDDGVYTLYVLPCEKDGAAIEKNAIVVGLYSESKTIQKYVQEEEIKEGGYLVKVIKNPACEEGNVVIITAREEQELFYGAVGFLDDYVPAMTPWHGAVRLPRNTFIEPMVERSYTENATFKTRGIFAWGHPINDYRLYIENMARLKLNQLILWNDYMPLNVQDIIDYAHSFGIKVIFGYAWGWKPGFGKNITDLSDARLQELKQEIIAQYEENYAKVNGDGIYFQSFTEDKKEYVNGRLIAEAVRVLVNDTANALWEKYPNLKLQFGLHATSVKNHLDEIAKVDKRIEIVWEDCGTFPYAYAPIVFSEKDFEETLEFTKKILTLRGDAPVGLLFKGAMTVDWTMFASQSGRFVLGNNATEIIEHDRRMRPGGWKQFSAEWMQYGQYALRMLRFIKENALSEVSVGTVGVFDGAIFLPEALSAQMFRTTEDEYGETLKKVARRDKVVIC